MMSRKLGKASQAVNGLTRRFVGLRGVMGPALASFTGFAIGSSFIQANASLEKMTLQLEAMTGSSEAAARSMDFIRKFQDEHPVTDIETLTDAYKDLVAGGINPTTGALKSLIAGSLKFGLTAADIKGVTRALKQTTAVTNAQKQELNQLAERIPGIQKMVAKEMGMSTDRFLKDMERRILKSNDVAAATLRALGKDSDEVLRKFSGSWQATISRIKTSWFNLMTRIGETGAFDDVKDAIDSIANFIKNRSDAIVNTWSQMRFIMREVFHQVKESLIGVFSGADINDSVNKFFDMLTIGWGEVQKTTVVWIEHIKNGFNVLIKGINHLSASSETFSEMFVTEKQKNDLEDTKNVLKEMEDQLKALTTITSSRGTRKRSPFLIDKEEVQKTKEYIRELKQEISDMQNSFGQFELFEEVNIEKRKSDINEETQARLESLRKIRKENKANIEALTKLKEKKLSELAQSNESLGTTVDESGGEVESAKTFLSGWTSALKEIKGRSKDTFENMQSFGEAAAKATTRAFETGLTNLFDNVIDGKITKFRDLMLNVVKDIAKALARLAAQQAAQGIASSIGSIFSRGQTNGNSVNNNPGGANGAGINSNTGAVNLQKSAANSALRSKAAGSSPNMKIEVINNSGELLQATETQSRHEFGQQIMSVVIDSIRTNKNGSRDSLRAGLA